MTTHPVRQCDTPTNRDDAAAALDTTMTIMKTGPVRDDDGASAQSVRFPATRAEGLRRLADFLPRAARAYADNRNTDLGPRERDNVSVLSPYLRYRLITEREVIVATLGRHSASASQKFVQEVAWRTYWKGWLELRPEAWTRFLAERDAARETATSDVRNAVEAAETGATGIDGFDDWARELVATGYLHNHARMWFASIWIFTLKLPWTLGADFFLRHLIDADPASNTLSWRWVAGLQTQGKPYIATAENIARFTEGRFHPQGLASEAIALEEASFAAPRTLPTPAAGSARPALLLLTGDDLCPESLLASGTEIRSTIVATGTGHGWPFGDKARAFAEAAAVDAAERAKARFRCPVQTVDALDASTLMTAAEAAQTKEIFTGYAPVGPVADRLASLTPELAKAGLTLVQRRRGWDSRFWPHATKGYFAFKEKIPQVLAEEGLRF
jgi:deoxyribodipyrimidine photo-lyase